MLIFNDKQDIISRIKSLRSLLSNDFDFNNPTNSFQSINNRENIIEFLIDLLKSLVGWDSLKQEVIQLLSYQITPIEVAIKLILKNILKKYFFCNTDSIIPSKYICNQPDTTGLNIPITSIDFFQLLKIDPTSETGQMLYGNQQLDLNTFLYDVIQENGNPLSWQGIIDVTFYETGQVVEGVPTNNVFNVCINESYLGLTVHQFVNNFIDSIGILQLELLVSRVFDGIFGTLNRFEQNCFERVKNEEEFNLFVNKIIDFPDTVIDNSFFEFSNLENNELRDNITNRTRGLAYVKECCFTTQEMDFNDLSDLINDLKITSNNIEIQTILENKFNTLLQNSLSGLSGNDSNYNILSFYSNFFRGIIRGILNILFSPKIIFMFSVYMKIVTGTVGFTNLRDFIRAHQDFFKEIITNVVLPIIIRFIMRIIIREVKRLLAREVTARLREKTELYRLHLQSLSPIPTNDIFDFFEDNLY